MGERRGNAGNDGNEALITLHVPLAEHVDPALLPHLQLTLTIALPPDLSLPEAPPRTGLPGLLDLTLARVGVEVGVQRGEFSAFLLSNWPGKLWLVDMWRHQPDGYEDVANVSDDEHEANYQATLETMQPYIGRFDIIKGCSVCAAPFFDNDSLDFVYLDANHSYEAVTEDLAAWLPKLKPGGLMCGHDFVDYSGPLGSFQVRSAVLDWAGRDGLKVYASREAWPSLWFFVKR